MKVLLSFFRKSSLRGVRDYLYLWKRPIGNNKLKEEVYNNKIKFRSDAPYNNIKEEYGVILGNVGSDSRTYKLS